MRNDIKRLVLIAAFAAAAARCGTGANKGTLRNEDTANVDESGGEVGIDDGSKVSIPAGALAIGSQVTVQKVDAPTEFAVAGAQAASGSVEILAKNADGTPVTQATSPLTVSLVVDSGAGLALAGSDPANLCVLLKSNTSQLYVWRRTAITLDDTGKTAKIQTLFFGVFQLVYCGSNALSGFTDAALVGATGEPKFSASLTVPSGFDASLSAGKYCMIALREDNSGRDACEAQGKQDCSDMLPVLAATTAAAVPADVTLKADVPQSQVAAGQTLYLGVFLLDAAAACPVKAGDNIATVNNMAGVKSFYAYRVTSEALKAGISGTLGADGPYKNSNVTLAIGGPAGAAAYPTFDEPQVCIEVDHDNGHMDRRAPIQGSLISGQSLLTLTVPTGPAGLGSDFELRARIGEECTSLGDSKAGDPKTGKPYWVSALGSTSVYLTPVTLHVHSTNSAYAGLNGCLDIAPPGVFDQQSSQNTGRSTTIGRFFLALNGDFKIFLPYLSGEKYDMQLSVLDAGTTCDDRKGSVQPVMFRDKPLSPDIDLQL